MTTKTGQRPRKRKRSLMDGRLVLNVSEAIGGCVEKIAYDLGVVPSVLVRMMVVEGLNARGYDRDRIEKEFGRLADLGGDDAAEA